MIKDIKKYIERQTRLTSGGVGVSKLTFFYLVSFKHLGAAETWVITFSLATSSHK